MDSEKREKTKAKTISDFLKDLHVEADSLSES